METDESMRCPKCKRIATKLISPQDNGEGVKICRRCKRGYYNDIRKKQSNDYNKSIRIDRGRKINSTK